MGILFVMIARAYIKVISRLFIVINVKNASKGTKKISIIVINVIFVTMANKMKDFIVINVLNATKESKKISFIAIFATLA